MAVTTRRRKKKQRTIGEIDDQLTALHQRLSDAAGAPPPGTGLIIASCLAAIDAVLDKIEVQGLHQDALVLGKLTDELQGATNELNELKATLEQIAAVAEFGAALLNTVASILPLL
jgi:hypothetical protein